MFCPKCGTENPDTGKFCRSCGTDLGNVSAALSGELTAAFPDAGVAHLHHEARRRNDPNEVYADAVKSIISGIGFMIVSIVLFTTGVAGGHAWWWAMLFPAFTFLAKGISDLLKSKRMESSRPQMAQMQGNELRNSGSANALPPIQTQFVAPDSRYKTGDLAPPSVTDDTTRHLEMNSEGETMALPKK